MMEIKVPEGMVFNKDTKIVNELLESISNNNGYCISVHKCYEHPELICPCVYSRNINECVCGLFTAIKE